MNHPLDRPAWTALQTRHVAFARGNELARRYEPSIVPFAATAADEPENLDALASLVSAGESVLMLQADAIVPPAGFSVASAASGVQMVGGVAFQAVSDAGVKRLSNDDAAEMLALAALTRPGPFTLRALELGAFWGVRMDGKLAAMAGERMKQPGYAEISGVCVHPDARGRGLARRLSLLVANHIVERGETPYLHAYATNAAAIGLYESIGFRLRSTMNVALVQRTD